MLATLSLVALLAVQLTWLNTAYSLEEKEFDLTVNVALSTISKKILAASGAAVTASPVKQLSSSFFLAELQAPIQAAELDTLLKREFAKRHLQVAYEYGILNAEDDTLVYGNYIPATYRKQPEQRMELAEAGQGGEPQRFNFAVVFPSKTTHILSEMSLWLFTAAALLVVVVFFAYTLRSILKEKQLAELKENFINNMTHELQTPITNIAIASEVLRNADTVLPQEKVARYHQIIHQENERLKAQVERVLQMAVLEKKELVLTKTVTNVHLVLEDALQGLRMRLQQRAGQVRFNLKASQNTILADNLHLTNVIYNLLDNAEKYSPAAPDIEVSTADAPNGILISIADKGLGMSKDMQRFVFDKFFRVPTGNVHNVKGFGLGLSYVKTIIEAHRGYIQLDSKENQGSRFDLYFPVGG